MEVETNALNVKSRKYRLQPIYPRRKLVSTSRFWEKLYNLVNPLTAIPYLSICLGFVLFSNSTSLLRNPISLSAAAIYLACRLEDKRKTHGEICKVTGLTDVSLCKV